jgi:L-cysteine/cystine lyase
MPRVALDAVAAAFEHQQTVGPFSAEGLLWAESEVAQTKSMVASLLRSEADAILLTESVSAACSTVLWGFDWRPGDEVIVTDCENPSVLAALMSVGRGFSLTIRELAVRGLGDEAILVGLEALLSPRSRLLIASHVSWIDGQILPLRAMADLIHDCYPEMAILADGAQAVGCIDVRSDELDCDFYAFTGSKWVCGPEGCAAVCISRRWRDRIQPSHSGARAVRWSGGKFEWRHGLRKLECGTKPIALLAGFREALRFHQAFVPLPVRIARMARLTSLARMPLGELAVSGGADGIVSFRVPFPLAPAEARGLVHFLEARDVLIREIPGLGIWRVCLHYFSTESEILRWVELLSGYLDRSRNGQRREVCAAGSWT